MTLKAVIPVRNMRIETEADNVPELFAAVADIQEVFGEPCCGLCQNTDLVFQTRTIDGNTYRDLKCTQCYATLSFGVRKKDGKLFPKRRLLPNGKPAKHDDPNGQFGNHNGWSKYRGPVDDDGDSSDNEPAPVPVQQTTQPTKVAPKNGQHSDAAATKFRR